MPIVDGNNRIRQVGQNTCRPSEDEESNHNNAGADLLEVRYDTIHLKLWKSLVWGGYISTLGVGLNSSTTFHMVVPRTGKKCANVFRFKNPEAARIFG